MADRAPPRAILQIVALALLTTPSTLPAQIAPTLVADYLKFFGLSSASASMLITWELAGLTAASFITARFSTQLPFRPVALTALVLLLAGQLGTYVAPSFATLAACRLLVGIASGVAGVLALAALARFPSVERNFAVLGVVGLMSGVAFLAALPLVFNELVRLPAIGASIAFDLLAIAAMLCLGRSSPSGSQVGPDHAGTSQVGLFTAGSALLALLLIASSFGATWPLIGEIGLSLNVPKASIDAALPVAIFSGLIAAILVSIVGDKLPKMVTLSLLSVAMGLAIGALSFGAPFIPAMIFIMALWVCILPFYAGLLAAIDKSGRLASFVGAVAPMGVMGGQLVAASTVSSGFVYITLYSAFAACLATLFANLADRTSVHRRQGLAAQA